MKLRQLSLRELFLLLALVAMGCGWWVERRSLTLQIKRASEKLQSAERDAVNVETELVFELRNCFASQKRIIDESFAEPNRSGLVKRHQERIDKLDGELKELLAKQAEANRTAPPKRMPTNP